MTVFFKNIFLLPFLFPVLFYAQVKPIYDNVDLNLMKTDKKLDNVTALIRNKEELKYYFSNSDTLNFDFSKNNLVLCFIKDTKVLACNELISVKLINDNLSLTVHHIGEDMTIKRYVLGFKMEKTIKVNTIDLKFINYGHGSRQWADSLCNIIKLSL